MNDWTNTPFEPWAGLAGGIMIGVAVVILLLCIGKIAGISGIAAGAITKKRLEQHWRLAFLAGMLSAAPLYQLFAGPFEVQTQFDALWMGIAGLLVGFGTRLGSGCTSGHGVAGLARFSPRSIVATLVFFGAAVITTNTIRYFI